MVQIHLFTNYQILVKPILLFLFLPLEQPINLTFLLKTFMVTVLSVPLLWLSLLNSLQIRWVLSRSPKMVKMQSFPGQLQQLMGLQSILLEYNFCQESQELIRTTQQLVIVMELTWLWQNVRSQWVISSQHLDTFLVSNLKQRFMLRLS